MVAALRTPVLGTVGLANPEAGVGVAMTRDELESYFQISIACRKIGRRPPVTLLLTSARDEAALVPIATGIAAASALGGATVMLADCDLNRPSLAAHLDLRPAPGLREYLCSEAVPREILQPVALSGTALWEGDPGTGEPPRLIGVAAGRQSRRGDELLATKRFAHFAEKVSHGYGRVVLKGPALLDAGDPGRLIGLADATVIVSGPQGLGSDDQQAIADLLAERAAGAAGVVLAQRS